MQRRNVHVYGTDNLYTYSNGSSMWIYARGYFDTDFQYHTIHIYRADIQHLNGMDITSASNFRGRIDTCFQHHRLKRRPITLSEKRMGTVRFPFRHWPV